MAWQRDEANLGISGATAYSYTEVDWEVHGDKCTYRHIGGVTSPYNFGATATSTLQWWEGGTWHDYAGPASGTFNGYGDLALVDVEDHFVRQAADRVVSLGCYTTMMGGSARAWIDYTVPHLAPSVTWAASNPVVRDSDNSITLNWNAPALEYSAMCLEVSTDGGSWSQFAVLWNTATSYTWTGCSAGHSYQFRIRTNYLASYSEYDVCATVIVNTPLPPDKLTTQATSGTNVTVTLVNTSPVATSCEYRLGDGTNWGAVVTGQDTQSFSVDMGSYHYIQVRNANATGTSNWRQSSYINTVTKPNKPTLWEPVGGAIVEPGDITFSWVYNSADGSEQSAWELEYTLPMQPTPTTVSSTASTATDKQTTITMNEGWEPYWRVRTKGASSSWSDWSSGRTLRVYSAPTVSIAAITATGMPISISATYSDTHQPYPMGDPVTFDCVYAAVTLKSGNRTILTKPATISGTSLTCEISPSDAILDNGATYTIVLDVRSSSGLQASANATFTTAFTEPQAGELSITNDPETGYASLLATFDNHASEITYSGSTNAQYESTEGYVRSLTVEGMSEKWNQLVHDGYFPSSSAYWQTHGGCSEVVSDNVITMTTTVDGTSIGKNNFLIQNIPFDGSHKYYVGIDGKGSRTTTLAMYYVATSGSNRRTDFVFTTTDTWTHFGQVKEFADTTQTFTQIRVQNYTLNLVTGDVFSFRNFLIVDLTAIYGSGNESSAATFEASALYKTKYAPNATAYDAGSLVSIGSVGVRGRNLLDVFTEFPKADTTYQGCTIVNNGDGSFTVSGKNTSTSGFNFNSTIGSLTLKAGTYTFQGNGTLQQTGGSASCYIGFTINGSNYGLDPLHPEPRTMTFNSDATLTRWYVWVGTSGTISGTCYPMIVEGDQGAPWEPYSLTTITTPLRSAGSVHDTLMADADSYTVRRNVGAVDLGTLTWYASSAVSTIYHAQVPNMYAPADALGRLDGILCAKYAVDTIAPIDSRMGDKTMKRSSGEINIRDDSIATAAAFTTAMSGVYLFYELATPTQDAETSMSRIEIGSAFTINTDLDSTFAMTTWDGSADAVSISVARVNADGSITPLIEDAASGAGAVDRYAPLNTPYQYAVTTMSAAHAVNTVYVDNEIITDLWFAYWTHKDGDTVTEMTASAKWNPDNGGIQLSRPQKTRVYYAGRKDPVSYDGSAVALSETPSWMLVDRSEVQPFVQLIEDGGRGVYKSCDGWVYHADFDLTLSPKYTAIGYYGGIMLSVTRIAGDQL